MEVSNSEHGPPGERERHVILLLARQMLLGAEIGCFLSQRALGVMVPVDHKTVGNSLRWLRENGWVDATPRRSQYGRMGYTWRPAAPVEALAAIGEPKDSPMGTGNGDTRAPQSGSSAPLNGESASRIGELRAAIGELPHRIGEPWAPLNQNLNPDTEKDLNLRVAIAGKPERRHRAFPKAITDEALYGRLCKLREAGCRTIDEFERQLSGAFLEITPERLQRVLTEQGAKSA